jgi:hypothetical protein
MLLTYESETSSTNPSLHAGPKFFKSPRLLLYQRAEAFELKVFASRCMHLDRNRSLEIQLCSGWNDVQSGELHIRAATAGLRLQTSEVNVVSGELDVLRNSDPGVIRFESLPSGSRAKVRIPFSLEQDVNEVTIKLEISYTTGEGTFFFASNPSISIMLPLGVNVQDVFKHKALFSKFTISSADTSPLRLLRSRLDDSDVFEARNGGDIRNPVVVFPRQPASLLYKITPRHVAKPVDANGRPRKEKSSLSLVIHYICLEEEIDNAVRISLQDALSDSSFQQFVRLIVPTVLSQLRLRLSAYDLERTALISELSTSILKDVKWREYFHGLGKAKLEGSEDDAAIAVEKWIQAWRDKHYAVQLPRIEISEAAISKSRSIVIPVEVPAVTVVHTADIKLQSEVTLGSELLVVANQPIPATLQIKSTRIWDTAAVSALRSSSKDAEDSSDQPEELEFVYEISAPTDSWLIGGKRKGHFKLPANATQKQGTLLEFPLLLIPVREGSLTFPHLDIKPTPVTKATKSPDKKTTTGVGEEKEHIVTCETDYKNFGETVRVVADLRKTTVSLDESGPQGGAWLLDAERRGEGSVVAGLGS